jgi:hypothetical protein
MKNEYYSVNVIAHIMLKNFWEYYITDESFNNDIVRAIVMGFETEIGDISLNEIKPYVVSITKNLKEVMPATGWNWVD